MSLREEMARYEQLTGESAEHIPISRLGGYLDGVDRGIEELEKIKAEIKQYGSIMAEWNDDMTKEEIVESVLKQAKECVLFVLDNHISELKGESNES